MFGQMLADFQVTQAKLADMATAIEAGALLTYRAACARDVRGERITREAAMAKMFATEACLKVVDEVTRIYGANGFASEYGPQRYFRDARFLLYGGGTHEIIKDFVGRGIVRER